MTLQDLIALHRDKVRNWSVANLKADKDFMADSTADREFRDWVLSQRPDMARKKNPYECKFKRPEGIPKQ